MRLSPGSLLKVRKPVRNAGLEDCAIAPRRGQFIRPMRVMCFCLLCTANPPAVTLPCCRIPGASHLRISPAWIDIPRRFPNVELIRELIHAIVVDGRRVLHELEAPDMRNAMAPSAVVNPGNA